MTRYAKLRSDAVIFNPIAATGLPTNAIFCDSASNGDFSINDAGGVPGPISGGSGGSSGPSTRRQQQCAAPIAALVPYSKLPDGRIVPADSDAANGQKLAGITIDAFVTANDLGYVNTIGIVIPNILAGLGFSPGDEIFLGENGGYTKNPGAFTGDNDSIIRIGIADCPAGVASSLATDLIPIPHIIARPPSI